MAGRGVRGRSRGARRARAAALGWSGGDDDDYGAADLDLVAFLETLGLVDAAVVEPGAIGGVEVLDEPEAVRQLEQGVVAGGVLVADHQAALPAGGEVG